LGLLKDVDAALLAFLQTFDAGHRQPIATFLSTVLSDIATFIPAGLPVFNYAGLVTAINGVAGVTTPLPATIATQLQALETAEISEILATLQTSLNASITGLLTTIGNLCLSELLDFIRNGLFASQLTAALTLAGNEITNGINSELAAQIALLQAQGLPAAALALAIPALQGQALALTTALNGDYATLVTNVNGLLGTLITTLATHITTGVKGFQNLAIAKFNALVTSIFGTIGVPAPIPPVV